MVNSSERKKVYPRLADSRSCTGCMACVDICPKGALSRIVSDDGHCYVRLNKDLCIGCLKCEKLCNTISLDYGSNDLSLSTPYAAWSLDTDLRKNSTSGGIFATIARDFINRGGVVVGTSFDGVHAYHKAIRTQDEIRELQGSKYTQSNTKGIYKEISSLLKENKVLFSGLGCQVAAIIAYFRTSPYRENLYTIDLICGGVPSSLLMSEFLKNNPQIERLTSFRSKRKYVLKGIVNNQEVILDGRPLPLYGFSSHLTQRHSCYNCRFAYAHRSSDLTIGDLWGNNFAEENGKGVSVIIRNSDRANSLLSKEIHFQPIEWKDFLSHSKRLVYPKFIEIFSRRHMAYFFKKLSFKNINKMYALSIKYYDVIWLLYKVYAVFMFKLNNLFGLIYVRNLLRNNFK